MNRLTTPQEGQPTPAQPFLFQPLPAEKKTDHKTDAKRREHAAHRVFTHVMFSFFLKRTCADTGLFVSRFSAAAHFVRLFFGDGTQFVRFALGR